VKLKIDFYLSDKARDAAFVATGDRPGFGRRVEFDMVTEATPEQRAALIEKFGSSLDVIGLNDYAAPEKYGVPPTLELDTDPAWPEAFALLMHEADAKAKRKARKDAEWQAKEAAEQADKARREAEALAKREAEETARAEVEAAKAAWINTHGSDHLRRAFAREHNCQRMYVLERARQEALGYTVDFEGNAEWKARACPSEAALDEAARIEALGLGEVRIVWLTSPARAERLEYYDDPGEFEPCEAVVVRDYLGKYDLVRQM
jgi:hypothetical protein